MGATTSITERTKMKIDSHIRRDSAYARRVVNTEKVTSVGFANVCAMESAATYPPVGHKINKATRETQRPS